MRDGTNFVPCPKYDWCEGHELRGMEDDLDYHTGERLTLCTYTHFEVSAMRFCDDDLGDRWEITVDEFDDVPPADVRDAGELASTLELAAVAVREFAEAHK